MHVVAIYAAKQTGKKVQVRLMLSSARAGFPSPADDHVEKQLDLNDHLIGDKAATFIVRAKGRQTRRRPRLVSACPTPPNKNTPLKILSVSDLNAPPGGTLYLRDRKS